ncbi:hypothetical protein Y032_0320g2405 [Ancylostoma ceylanicum]|uniref:Fungal lipase-type domain-containing protein n=1 Tax=Ancylostoma ceylanicum TaxID=53326 RepID=A0A016S0W2_9BILA|nr:hypothetical protein Y032_0320g2405 [Ancylostoma ceylanicum]
MGCQIDSRNCLLLTAILGSVSFGIIHKEKNSTPLGIETLQDSSRLLRYVAKLPESITELKVFKIVPVFTAYSIVVGAVLLIHDDYGIDRMKCTVAAEEGSTHINTSLLAQDSFGRRTPIFNEDLISSGATVFHLHVKIEFVMMFTHTTVQFHDSKGVPFRMISLVVALIFMLDSASGNTSEEEERLDFYEYSDHFARKMMLTISAAAYSDDPQQCLSHILGRVTGTYQYSYPCQDSECSVFVAKLEDYRAIAIGFRGTQKPGQLIQQTVDAVLAPWEYWKHGGRVSRYIKFVYIKLWAHMEHKFKEFLREHPDWDIWISGHSLGGALATLAASNIVESRIAEDPDKVKLVTLGQPRVGDKDFAEALDDQVEYSYRIVHWMDVVPSLPKTGYWHQGEEIFYKAGMEPHESSSCGRGDSVYCSAQYLPTSINDHKTYFGKHVSDYGKGAIVSNEKHYSIALRCDRLLATLSIERRVAFRKPRHSAMSTLWDKLNKYR